MMSQSDRPWQKIQWARRPASPLTDIATRVTSQLSVARVNTFTKLGLWALSPLAKPPISSLDGALRYYGTPHVPGATALEEAVVLLRAAAEVEHALLVQYLYAAWSIGTDTQAIAISDVAIQEMCHFLTVQNLLLFAGSRPSVQRQDLAPTPELDPFAFTLRPFSRSVLQDFLLTEMPAQKDMSNDQRQVMDPIIAERQQQGSIVHPVGLIYAKLYWLFQEDDEATAEWPEIASSGRFERGRHIASFPGEGTAKTFQADPLAELKWRASFDRGGVFESIGTRPAALHTLFEIAQQGEGLAGDAQRPSHFSTFLEIYKSTDFNTVPSSNWPTDPFVSSQPASDPVREANRITNPAAVALSGVLDLRYRIALASIRAALSRDRTNPTDLATRTTYIGWAFDEMKPFLLGGVSALTRQPLKSAPDGGQMVAAPSFNLTGFSLPDDAPSLDQALFDLHRQAALAINGALSQSIDIAAKSLLHKMQQNDKSRYPNLAV